MGVDALRTLATTVSFNVLGVPVTVTPSNDDAIVTTSGIWHGPLREDQPFGSDYNRRAARKVMSIQRTTSLDHLPRGTQILAPEIDGGAVKAWRVDGYDGVVEPEVLRVILVEVGQ